jgi:polysaccharide export outer membrane protein
MKKATVYTLSLLLAMFVARTDAQTEGDTPISEQIGLIQALQATGYRIGPSDKLSILIWNHDEMSRSVTVRPDGMISYPLIGEVKVAGLTPTEFHGIVVERIGEYINVLDREVSVMIDEVHSFKVSVLGDVRDPGRYEFQSHVTVLDALATAGGLTEFADTDEITIIRLVNNGVERIDVNYRDIINPRRSQRPAAIYPGDIVIVP